ncbi:adhesion G-protein coupled receptor V1-like [Haliotis asinina]|uniref:adhesion G-protein coupled receptor V1-like n=1 Tax=Haliotis asinina TaxID=109174 RepID=UPI0035320130
MVKPGAWNLLVVLVVILQCQTAHSQVSVFNLVPDFTSTIILEGQMVLNVNVTRGGGTEPSTVTYTVTSEPAVSPVVDNDTLTLMFEQDQTQAVIPVQLVDDAIPETSQPFVVTLVNASSGSIGTTSSLTYSARDDDQIPGDWNGWVEGVCGGPCDGRFRTDTRTRTCNNFSDPFRTNCITSDTRTVACPITCVPTTTKAPGC